MDTFDKLLEFQKELLQSQLKIIYRHQKQSPQFKKQPKRTSKLEIVETYLHLLINHSMSLRLSGLLKMITMSSSKEILLSRRLLRKLKLA